MSRKTKCASGPHLKSANTTTRKDKLPPDPEGSNDHRAAVPKELIEAFRSACQVDPEDTVGDFLTNLMHLCDRVHRLGTFDAGLVRAYSHYKWETATDAEYARM